MYSIELKVDTSTYQKVMQFLSGVDVLSLKATQLTETENKTTSNCDALLAAFNKTDPLLKQIADPVEWQKNLRDEWQ